MKVTILILIFSFVMSAFGETWKNLGSQWYVPTDKSYSNKIFDWVVTDSSGAESIINFSEDGNNANEVINSIKSTVKSLFTSMVPLSNEVANHARELERMDLQFNKLATELDLEFALMWIKMDLLEIQMEDGSKATMTKTGESDNKTTYVLDGLTLKDDKRSILVSTEQDGSRTVSIRGWAAGGGCEENLKDLVTNYAKASARRNHKLLTRYTGGSGEPQLHYLPLGDLLKSIEGVKVYGSDLQRDNEGKVDIKNLVKSILVNGDTLSPNSNGVVDLGDLDSVTQSVTVSGNAGSEQIGHKIRFDSMDDSNVKIEAVTEGDTIVVKIGVYYK